MQKKNLIVLLLLFTKNMQGGSFWPRMKEEPSVDRGADVVMVYNFSYSLPHAKSMSVGASSIPSCSTDVIPNGDVTAQSISTNPALVYVSSATLKPSERMDLVAAIVQKCNRLSITSMTAVLPQIIRRMNCACTIELLVPSYRIRYERGCYGTEQCICRRVSPTRDIITFGEGKYKRAIAYTRWLALSSVISYREDGLCIGVPDVLSPSIQLVDVLGVSGSISYKAPSQYSFGMYSTYIAAAKLRASTCEPEETACILKNLLVTFKKKQLTKSQALQGELRKVLFKKPYISSIVLELSFEENFEQKKHFIRAFRESDQIKSYWFWDGCTQPSPSIQDPSIDFESSSSSRLC